MDAAASTWAKINAATIAGAEARFRDFALTATGNQAGGATLFIERPERTPRAR